MANKLQITASLNIPNSQKQIEADLKTIESQLKPIQLNAQINSDSIKQQTQQIQSQISNAVNNASNSVSLDKVFNFDSKNMTQLYSQLDTYKAKLNELSSTAQAQWKIITNSKGDITGANLSYYDDAAKAMVTENYKVTTTTNEANESVKRMALSTTTYSQNAYKAQQQLQAFNAKLAEFKTTVNSFGDKNVGSLLDNNSLGMQYQKLLTGLDSVKDNNGLNAVKNQFKELQTQTNQYIESEKLLKTESDNVFNSQVTDLQNVIKEQATAQTEVQQMSDKVALLAQQMQVLETRASSAGVSLNQSSVNSFTDALNNGQLEKAKTLYQQIRLEYQQLNAEMSKQLPQNAIDNMNTRAKALESTISTIESKFSTITLGNNSGWSSQVKSVDANIQQLRTNLDAFNKAQVGQDKVEAFNKLNTSVKDTKKQVDDLVKSQKALAGVDISSNKFEAYLKENEKVATKFPTQVNAIRSSLQSLGNETDTTKLNIGLQNVNKQFTDLRASAQAAGAEGRTVLGELGNDIKKMATWAIGGTAIFGTVNEIKDMYSEIVKLDDQMVELRKVTDESEATYNTFYHTANETAKSLGATTESVIGATASWAQMGYSIKDASELAKDSEIFKNISENMSVEEATNSLISTVKAFKINTNDALDGVISKVNEVGNKFAVTNKDIAEGLERSASSMAVANNTMDQTIALLTAATEITRDADSAGTALKTISMRIRGIDEETGTTTKELKAMASSIKGLSGVSVFTDETKQTYKSTYQILQEISKVFDKLSDKSQATLLEDLAGKRQGNVVASILSNFSTAEKALEVQANSTGGALREQSTYMDSISAHANKLKETFVGLGQNIINTGATKGILDVGTNGLNLITQIVDKLGLVPTILSGIVATMSLLNRNGGKQKYAHLLKVA